MSLNALIVWLFRGPNDGFKNSVSRTLQDQNLLLRHYTFIKKITFFRILNVQILGNFDESYKFTS